MDRRNILVICDFEQKYCFRLDEYLRQKLSLPFEFYDFTNADDLRAFSQDKKARTAALIISQSAYEKSGNCGFDRLLILEEPSDEIDCQKPDIPDDVCAETTAKYQSMEGIVSAVLNFCMNHPDTLKKTRDESGKLKVIGGYSPVRRCGQSSFLKNLGQVLGRNSKVLYLSFDPFLGQQTSDESGRHDLQDLLYFFENDPSRLQLYLERCTVHDRDVDMILPAASFLALKGVDERIWDRLIGEIGAISVYDYLILDLSEITDGFTSLLERCSRIFTVRIPEPYELAKLAQYEKVMRLTGHGDVLERTTVFDFPGGGKGGCNPSNMKFAAAVWQNACGFHADARTMNAVV